MPIEAVTYISDFVVTNPVGATDPGSDLDDHIKNMKIGIKTTFPNVTGAVTPTHTELNYVDGVTSAIQTQLDAKIAATSGTFTATCATGMTTTPTATWSYTKIDSVVTLNIVQISGTGNAATITVTGAPAAIHPTNAKRIIARLRNDGTYYYGSADISAAGVITIYSTDNNPASFSGSSGIESLSVSYTLA